MKTLHSWTQKSNAPRARGGHISPLAAHPIAASGESVGTFFFLWMGYSGQIVIFNQAPALAITGGISGETVVYTALVYGLSLLVNAWAFYRISGGLFNPAVSLGLSLSGQVPWLRTAFLVPAQVLASMCAAGLVAAMFAADLAKVNTVLARGTSAAQGLFIEMVMTAQLVFVILMLAAEKSRDTFIAPVGIGLALFSAELTDSDGGQQEDFRK
ncbi:Aquaporin-1 [Diaporthe eres]|nr:Aquaporin-1 [Diaporthe eres]